MIVLLFTLCVFPIFAAIKLRTVDYSLILSLMAYVNCFALSVITSFPPIGSSASELRPHLVFAAGYEEARVFAVVILLGVNGLAALCVKDMIRNDKRRKYQATCLEIEALSWLD